MIQALQIKLAIDVLTKHFIEVNGEQPNDSDKNLIHILATERVKSGEPILPQETV